MANAPLTPTEWDQALQFGIAPNREILERVVHAPLNELAAIMAVANARLPRNDQRRITRDMVSLLTRAIVLDHGSTDDDATARLRAFGHALQAMLPPAPWMCPSCYVELQDYDAYHQCGRVG